MNKDGTGGSRVWPSETANWPKAGTRHPPVARSKRSQSSVSPSDSLSSNVPSGRFVADFDAAVERQLHAGRLGLAQEAVNDRLR